MISDFAFGFGPFVVLAEARDASTRDSPNPSAAEKPV